MSMWAIPDLLESYLRERPLFLSLIRARELELFATEFARGGLARLNSLHPILDIGCGDGYFASFLLKTPRIRERSLGFAAIRRGFARDDTNIDVGLDMPGSRMGEAEKLNVYKNLVEFDGVKIPFKNNYFPTIISNCVLEHVEHLPELLNEVRRVLKPGGKFITSVMARPWEENLVGAMVLGNSYREYMRIKQVHLNLLTRAEWREAFAKSKLRVTKEVGYLSPAACRLIDVCHYLSVPNLISYKLFGKWVLTPGFPPYPVKWLSSILEEPVAADKSGAIFYVLEKH